MCITWNSHDPGPMWFPLNSCVYMMQGHRVRVRHNSCPRNHSRIMFIMNLCTAANSLALFHKCVCTCGNYNWGPLRFSMHTVQNCSAHCTTHHTYVQNPTENAVAYEALQLSMGWGVLYDYTLQRPWLAPQTEYSFTHKSLVYTPRAKLTFMHRGTKREPEGTWYRTEASTLIPH